MKAPIFYMVEPRGQNRGQKSAGLGAGLVVDIIREVQKWQKIGSYCFLFFTIHSYLLSLFSHTLKKKGKFLHFCTFLHLWNNFKYLAGAENLRWFFKTCTLCDINKLSGVKTAPSSIVRDLAAWIFESLAGLRF